MTETYDLTTQIAIIREARRQGYPDAVIAERLGLPNDDPIFTVNPEGRSLGYALSDIGEGFREWELFHLPEDDKRKLLILMARISESSFRRGQQHGNLFASKGERFKIHPDKLRWGNESLDSARMALCGTKMTSLERLQCQHGGTLQALGFGIVNDPLQ